MRKPSIAVLIVACMLPVVLAMTYLGTTTYRIYFIDANLNATLSGTVTEPNDNGDIGVGYLCWTDACRFCAMCHINGQNRSKQVETSARHQQNYYPRAALMLSEAQRFSWGEGGGYLTSRAGRIEYRRKDGTLSLAAPAGSLILKDAAGKPFVLWMPGDPTLHPKAR